MNNDQKPPNTMLPVLYSLRNCPFAMRARLAIFKSKQAIELRDIVLSNKPDAMLLASPKGTVPILVLPHLGKTPTVIDESLDIMLWALNENDPDNLLFINHDNSKTHNLVDMLSLIETFDYGFKAKLEAYRCAKRYHEANLIECRHDCEKHLRLIEQRLNQHRFIMSNQESLVDIALLPFIRQFAKVERQWYLQAPYPKLRQWLNYYLQSLMFSKVMFKYPLWLESYESLDPDNVIIFGQ